MIFAPHSPTEANATVLYDWSRGVPRFIVLRRPDCSSAIGRPIVFQSIPVIVKATLVLLLFLLVKITY